MNGPVRVGISGARGRMGLAVRQVLGEQEGLELAGLIGREETPEGELQTRETVLQASDVVIDFSTPEASASLARLAAEKGRPALVVGATGFSAAEERILRSAARRIALVKSGNFSLGVTLLARLVREAAEALPAALYDIEIFEAHHRRKIDAPSGTALLLGEAAASGRGGELFKLKSPPRDGAVGQRPAGQIGFSVLRGGGFVGEHQVVFAGEDEILTLAHSARDRRLFARGALVAARFAASAQPGLYDMQDVMGSIRASPDARS